MKKWQEERNYRRIYNEAGEAIANIRTVTSTRRMTALFTSTGLTARLP